MKNDYSCFMLNYNIPKWEYFISKVVDKNDLYSNELGYELEPHTTILYGLHDNVSIDDIRSIALPLKDIAVSVITLNCFESKDFDVVKFQVDCSQLREMNNIAMTFDHTLTHKEYNPHITLAYVKKGLGIKYIKSIKPFLIKPFNYYFSLSNGEKIFFNS